MSKVLLCSALLVTVACGNSDSNPGGGSSGAGTTAGTSNNPTAGSAGTANPGGGQATTGGSTGTAGNAGNTPTGGVATGGGGAGTTAGTGGTPTAGTGGTPPAGDGSVTQRGADDARTSHWLAPTLTKANVMTKMAGDTDFKANFTGELTGSPLFLAGATPGTGHFFVATTENDVYQLGEKDGAMGWKHNIGGYLASADVCGGDPKNHGIVSTPIIDSAKKVIYVAAAMTDKHHEIHALSTDTGMEVAGFPIDVSKIKAGNLAFPSGVQNQRSALSLVKGILYVAFGGYCGDQGAYHGWVIGVDTADPTKIGAWATMDNTQAGIWAAGGMASDGNGVFAVTGNAQGGNNHDTSDSEEIIRITGLGVGNRDAKNMFYPTEWANPMNSNDLDFGSASPTVVTVPGATPSTIIVAPAKPGRVYFLDAANLGGSLGQFADTVVAGTNGQTIYTTPTAYTTATGVHVAISAGQGAQCPGGNKDNVVMSMLLKPAAAGMPPMPTKSWCGAIGGGDTPKRSPISTNSSGANDPIVWYLNGGNLNGFDGEDGTLLYDSSKGATPLSCAGVHKFTTLIATNGRIVAGGDVGGQGHLCSWSVH